MISVTRTEPKCSLLYPGNHKEGTIAYLHPCLYVRTVRPVVHMGVEKGVEPCWMSIGHSRYSGQTYDKIDARVLGPGDMLTMNFMD